MTLNLDGNLIETDDSVEPRPGALPGTVIVRIKNGQNWNGNVFEDCDLQLPERLLRDASKRS